MLHKLVSALAWACLALIAFATLCPTQLRPELAAVESDSIVLLEHVGAFALVGFLFSVSHRRQIRSPRGDPAREPSSGMCEAKAGLLQGSRSSRLFVD
jgi:hypothetical protein